MGLAHRFIRWLALKHGRCASLYRRFCNPDGEEYAEFLKRHGGFHSIGEQCSILPATEVQDPAYVRIGNNVSLSSCALIGHDGSVAVLNRLGGVKLDRVGKIDIRDNVFIGYGAIILPDVTIGPNAVVGAGAVVTRDVAAGDVVAGVPATTIGRVDHLIAKLERQTRGLPWYDLIQQRDGAFDPELEPELVRRRVDLFFGGADPAEPPPAPEAGD